MIMSLQNKIYSNFGILFQVFSKTIFPLILVLFYRDDLNVGIYGEFIAFTSFVLPFVSLGQFNIYIIDNKDNVNHEKVLSYFILTILISLIFIFFDNKFIETYLFIIFLPFSFLELVKNQHLILHKKTKELIFYECIAQVILLYPFIFKDTLAIEDIILFKVTSVIIANSIFFIQLLINTKHSFKLSSTDILFGISFIPNKMITNSVDYILLNTSLRLGNVFQNNYYFLRKIAGVVQLFFGLKNAIFLKESYKNAGIKLLKLPFSYLAYFIIAITPLVMFFNFNLSLILIHLAFLDLCIGINYYIFLNKKTFSLYIINIVPIMILSLNFLFPNLFYLLIVVYAITKFILSYYVVKKSTRKLV